MQTPYGFKIRPMKKGRVKVHLASIRPKDFARNTACGLYDIWEGMSNLSPRTVEIEEAPFNSAAPDACGRCARVATR